MSSLMLIVFILQLVIHIVNTVGATTINSLLWNIYNRLPTPTSKAATEQRKLQSDFLKLRKELNATSAQDDFAKWAKLRRQHDKALDQLEKNKASLDGSKKTFDSSVGALRWLGTQGLRFILQFWYTKQPIYWIPQAWVPYYAEWLLSFPRAPLGSISIQVWMGACAAVILLVSDAVVAIIGLSLKARTGTEQKQKAEPMAGRKNETPVDEKSSTKKEL